MKKLIILFSAIIILHINGFSQLFDATIDGALPSTENELVGYFEKKGYSVVKDISYPKEMVFMMGVLRTDSELGNKYPVLLHLSKDENSNHVKSITVYFPPDTHLEFQQHKNRFQEKYGTPILDNKNKAEWKLADHTYIIGVEDRSVYHEIRENHTNIK